MTFIRWFLRVTVVAGITAVAGAPSVQAVEPDCEPVFSERLERISQLLVAQQTEDVRVQLDQARGDLPVDCPHARLQLDLFELQLLQSQGRLAAMDQLLRELELPQKIPATLEGRYLYSAGILAFKLGQFHRARGSFQKLLELDRASSSDPRFVASDLYLIAATFLDEQADGDQREAVAARFQTALAEAEAVGGARQVPLLYIMLGKLLSGEEGRDLLERGLDLARLPNDQVTGLGGLAVKRLVDDPSEARKLIDQALVIAEKALEEGQPWTLLHLLGDRLLVSWATRPRLEAVAESLEALAHIETVRGLQDDRTVQAGLWSVWTDNYQSLAGRILESTDESPTKEDLSLAFLVGERYRARVLADSLEAMGVGARKSADGMGNDEKLFASLDEVMASLADDEALLAYQSGSWKDVYGNFGGGAWLMSVSRAGTRIYRLPGKGPLERRVSLYLGLIAERSEAEPAAAARLYRDLLAPALEDLPASVDKLILVPDGKLHLLPFSALRPDPEAAPLAAQYQIATVPSATLWRGWKAAPGQASAAALVLANPRPGGVQAATLRTALGPLPHAAEEGQAVIRRVGRGSLLRQGDDASEAFLKGNPNLRRFGLLHFAAHAVVDEAHPELSAVMLAPGNGEDGDLQAQEVANLDLRGAIAVLSACHSASGNVLRGEGVMSLARSFFQAGASTVVGSLWPLGDSEARRLFDAFYRHLASGHSVRSALHRAQKDLRDEGAPVSAWAGVVVLGDGSRVPLARDQNWPFGLFATGTFIAIGTLVFILFLWLVGRRRASLRPVS